MFELPKIQLVSECRLAYDMVGQTYVACNSFHATYEKLREGTGSGTSTDGQQDTLRAMLIFACAGLDSAIKQLVRDALESVIDRNPSAQENFTESVRRRLPDMEKSRELLASVLTAKNPRQILIRRLMDDLLADSLQSSAQLAKVAAAFNISTGELDGFRGLKDVFAIRNQIIHEMDIDFERNHTRRQREKADMERHTRVVLGVATSFLTKVDEKLR